MIGMYSSFKSWDGNYGPFILISPYRTRTHRNRWGNPKHYRYRNMYDTDRFYSNRYYNPGMYCIYLEDMSMRHKVSHPYHPTNRSKPNHRLRHRRHRCLVVFILPLQLRHTIGPYWVYCKVPHPICYRRLSCYPSTIVKPLIDNLDNNQYYWNHPYHHHKILHPSPPPPPVILWNRMVIVTTHPLYPTRPYYNCNNRLTLYSNCSNEK